MWDHTEKFWICKHKADHIDNFQIPQWNFKKKLSFLNIFFAILMITRNVLFNINMNLDNMKKLFNGRILRAKSHEEFWFVPKMRIWELHKVSQWKNIFTLTEEVPFVCIFIRHYWWIGHHHFAKEIRLWSLDISNNVVVDTTRVLNFQRNIWVLIIKNEKYLKGNLFIFIR